KIPVQVRDLRRPVRERQRYGRTKRVGLQVEDFELAAADNGELLAAAAVAGEADRRGVGRNLPAIRRRGRGDVEFVEGIADHRESSLILVEQPAATGLG